MARYVPILRWKRGERGGLERLTPQGRAGVTPLFILAPQQFVGKKATAKAPAVLAPAVIASGIQQSWGPSPFYLDASELPPGPAHHPLEDIGVECRHLGLQMIPATRLNASAQYQQALAAVDAIDSRGVALRADLQGMTSTPGWIGQWPFAPADTDLIIDVGSNVQNVAALGGAFVAAFGGLHLGGGWRSVTFAGTSMPDNFGGFAAGLHPIQRTELALWQQLAAAGLPYAIDFGDYTTVPVNTPPAGIAWGYPINARYTLDTEFLICRGVGTTGFGGVDMDVQLRGHAGSIVGHAARGPLPHCWADGRIDTIAAGSQPGNLESWVNIGVNRHIELTRLRLP